ncbi:MAG: serine/threonine protein kinase, partial [Planctomycetes bacterium]|nr:serine/threonine protein kinase [Planctomycetota bacterium]
MSAWRETVEWARQSGDLSEPTLEWVAARLTEAQPQTPEALIRSLQGGPLQRAEGELLVEIFRRSWVATPAAAPPRVGEVVTPRRGELLGERFRVVGLLGQGGMGAVFCVDDLRARRRVALKRLTSALPTARLLKRFEREAQLTARVRHPGLVRVHEVGELEGQAFILYELVEGARTLGDSLTGLSRSDRLDCLEEIADAVAALHAAGIIHRDLKAENVLIDAAGRARILDLGIALDLEDQRLSHTGEVLGTPSYMAPEQVFGKKGQIGPTTDVWALGVLLYELLYDALPFEGTTLVALMAQIASGADSIKDGGDAPAALRAVYLRALAPAQGDRFQDALGFHDALAAARLEPSRRLRTPAAIALSLVLLGSLLGVFNALASERGASAPSPWVAAAPLASSSPEVASGERIDAEQLLRQIRSSLRTESPADLGALLATTNEALVTRPRWGLALAARSWARCFQSPERYAGSRADFERAARVAPQS